MRSTDSRNLFTTLIGAAASSSDITTIPATQGTPGNGRASIALGYPAETFVSRSAGGVPPFGQDANGFLNLLSAAIQSLQADFFGPYNASFASAINGYPLNAIVSAGVAGAFWVSTAENNRTVPGVTGASWQNLFAGLALTNGSSSNVFNVGISSPSTNQAVPRFQADTLYAALAGSTTQVFNVANATAATNAVAYGQAFGLGQSWTNVTSSRAAATTYYNTTAKPIFVVLQCNDTNGNDPTITVTVGGVSIITNYWYDHYTQIGGCLVSFVVPPGQSYSVTFTNYGSVGQWSELR